MGNSNLKKGVHLMKMGIFILGGFNATRNMIKIQQTYHAG
jgi:hypothetical protein